MLVDFNYVFDAVHLGVENVTVQSEAVVCILAEGRNGSSEAEHWDLLIAVIVLKNISNSFDGFQVLVALHIEIVERGRLRWVSIRQGKVDRDGESNLAPAKNVFKESVALFDFKLNKVHLVLANRPTLLIDKIVFLLSFFELG